MLFLLQTDLLGNRTYMQPTTIYYYKNNPDDGCGSPDQVLCGVCTTQGGVIACGSCQVYGQDQFGDWGCQNMNAWNCYGQGSCYGYPSAAHELRDGSGACNQALRGFWATVASMRIAAATTTTVSSGRRGRTRPTISLSRHSATGVYAGVGCKPEDLGGPHRPPSTTPRPPYMERPTSCQGPDGRHSSIAGTQYALTAARRGAARSRRSGAVQPTFLRTPACLSWMTTITALRLSL